MNRIALYILLILVFLGASRSILPDKGNRLFIQDQSNYSGIFTGSPLSVILVDAYKVGFAIKGHLHKYKVLRYFQNSQYITIRVSKDYFDKTLPYIGMSVFRRYENGKESSLILPPGTLLLGDSVFGRWSYVKNQGRVWKFYRAYRKLPNQLYWGDFVPTYRFYRQLKVHEEQKIPFIGPNNEFGSDGLITSKELSMKWYKSRNRKFSFKEYLDTLTKIPFIRN